MPQKKTSSRIKNEKQYEALRDKGYSKQKAARIANTPDSGKKGGSSKKYEEWPKKELYDKAKQVGIKGRSKMSKKELIYALRNN
ncbi:Rho termination factor [Maribellus comscasis]|uniref:Rho termination factor n=1 Tax=Maribellus comscasis TaxID=2681766 RepID=A0A6I6K5F3_9BACT|nr:Rho termination factor N-terminal domain-containing protein [Maribellus comscasis]QGY47692.1 Rho termination factor [Maribellus comscasis]